MLRLVNFQKNYIYCNEKGILETRRPDFKKYSKMPETIFFHKSAFRDHGEWDIKGKMLVVVVVVVGVVIFRMCTSRICLCVDED